MRGKLFGIGIGPGDPELLTVKAIRLIRETQVIALPDSSGKESVALGITRERLAGKTVVFLAMPMTKDAETLRISHDAAFEQVRAFLEAGSDVAFLTLGDPSIYSTFSPLQQRALAFGYEVETVAGVTSFCAAAARANIALSEREEMLTILPAYRETAFPAENVVLMKVGRHYETVFGMLRDKNRLGCAALIERCGMDGENVRIGLNGEEAPSSYFSTIIVKEKPL